MGKDSGHQFLIMRTGVSVPRGLDPLNKNHRLELANWVEGRGASDPADSIDRRPPLCCHMTTFVLHAEFAPRHILV